MKPEEAEKKWCPMSRIQVTTSGGIYDNHLGNYPHTDCIAGGCMAWVWDTPPSTNGKSVKHPGDGHCGLVKK